MFFEENSEVFLPSLDLLYNLFVEPLDSLPFFPEAVLELSICCLVYSQAMLLSSHPMAKVQSAVCPLVNAVAMLLVVFVFAHVATAIGPRVDSHSIHIII